MGSGLSDLPDIESKQDEVDVLLDLYLLGDSVDDIRLRNKMMEMLVGLRIVTSSGRAFALASVPQIKHIYERTPVNSPLRRMLIDKHVARLKCCSLAKYVAEYPAEFVQDMAVAYSKVVKRTPLEDFKAKLPSYLEPTSDRE